MTTGATIKGWCPGAYRPMMSGDGLIVRVRPFCARLSASQVLGLCALAQEHGNGFLDLTNRANIQIRGVQDARLERVLEALGDLGLLDAASGLETRRNIIVTPFWTAGDDTHRIYQDLVDALPQLPDLPAKFGFAIDAGPQPMLGDASGDIRIERGKDGLIVRADGVARGRPVTRETALAAVHEMAQWFASHRSAEYRRMSDVTVRQDVPSDWQSCTPHELAPRPDPGPHDKGVLLGATFGQVDAAALSQLMLDSAAPGLRVTPWRMFLLEGVTGADAPGFVTRADDPLLRVDACPGAPYCPSASVETRDLARHLATRTTGSLHVSGCPKGCARKAPADITIVGNEGRFDLVLNGHAWDAPAKSGLRPGDLSAEVTG